MAEITAFVKELNDRVYFQSPVTLYDPETTEIESFAFADAVKKLAPNPKIMWLQGRYVEADRANSNGDQWTAGDLAIKQLTPTLMPISVMHDLRSAVGTIADTALRLPSNEKDVPRARLETTLALWAHRFPEIAEEAKINAQQGTLMQSMECVASSYECSHCGKLYQYAVDRSDKDLWCAHLRGEIDETGTVNQGARILRAPTFTGTGLIFGTRGARGAYSEAYLDAEQLAEFHAKAHTDRKKSPKARRQKSVMEIEDKDYQDLVASKTTAEAKVVELTAQLTEKDKAVEDAEAAKLKAEEERDAEKQRADTAEEQTRVAQLRDDRMGALGAGFTAKLSKLEATNKRVLAQAGTLSDEDWEERVAELEETLSVKRDATADESASTETGASEEDETTAGLLFDRKEVAAAELTASAANKDLPAAPSTEQRQSVIGGLVRPRRSSGAQK
jgi:hypothetical protein